MDILTSYTYFSNLRAIFIGGARRSGTTLVQRLLDGHSQLLVYPLEDCIVRDFFFHKKIFDLSQLNFFLENRDWKNVYQCLVDNPKLALIFNPTKETKDPDASNIHFHLGTALTINHEVDEKAFQKNFLSVISAQDEPVDIGDITKIWIFTYFYTKGTRDFSQYNAWVTKCPEEGKCFAYYRQYFPDYKIIHLVRDPRGFYASEKQKRIELNQYKPDKSFKNSIELWKNSYHTAKKNILEDPENYYLLRFEDVILQSEKISRKFASFLGIKEEATLSQPTYSGENWQANSSFGIQTSENDLLRKQSLHYWKKALSTKEKINLEISLGGEMVELHYSDPMRVFLIQKTNHLRFVLKKGSRSAFKKVSQKWKRTIKKRNSLKSKSQEINYWRISLTDKRVHNLSSELIKLKNKYKGQRCFIMGNGPSLNKMDLSLLKDDYVWASNRVYLLFDRIQWRPKFYVAVDTRVVPDNSDEINRLSHTLPDTSFFFPLHFRYERFLRSSRNVYWYNEQKNNSSNLPYSMFSLNAEKFVYSVKTVTIAALQLAVYCGFNPIYLIGCDTNYSIPENVIYEQDNKSLIVSTTEDPNHFDKEYFGAGKKWHAPNVDRMIFHYEQAKKVCDEINVEVFDATVDGKLEVFPKVDYRKLFNNG